MSKKNKVESDSELLSRYKEIETHELAQGRPFDLSHELCAAIARRDYRVAEKKSQRQITIGTVVHYAIQLGLAYFAYTYWDDLKVLLVLLLIILWRSINRNAGQIKYLQIRTLGLLAMAHPKAEEEFFRSEHCYGTEISGRVYELLHKRPI